MAYRCNKFNTVIRDARQEGNGCSEHTELERMDAASLRNYYRDRRQDFPNGRYSCSFCRWLGNPV